MFNFKQSSPCGLCSPPVNKENIRSKLTVLFGYATGLVGLLGQSLQKVRPTFPVFKGQNLHRLRSFMSVNWSDFRLTGFLTYITGSIE